MNKFAKRLRALFHRRQLDRDLEDELAFHVAMNEQQGADAASARQRFGNATAFQEKCRERMGIAVHNSSIPRLRILPRFSTD